LVRKVGYLVYNGFLLVDTELNTAFGTLKSTRRTELVLDLRYNSGSVLSATRLASMITGQYIQTKCLRSLWNSKINAFFGLTIKLFKNKFADKLGQHFMAVWVK
jgi:hypothetical protein